MLIGTNLNEFVNGVDNPEADTLTNEELTKRVTAKYGDKSQKIIEAYRREYPHASPFGLFSVISIAPTRQNAFTQAIGRPPLARGGLISICSPGRRRCWMAVLAHSIAVRSHSSSITPSFCVNYTRRRSGSSGAVDESEPGLDQFCPAWESEPPRAAELACLHR